MAHANGQPLSCDAVEPRLLDLVYGELAEDEAAAVRAHAAGCDACARALGKLEGGRAIARRIDVAEDAPPAVMSAVLMAARAKAGENQRAAARARIASTERPSTRPARERRGAHEGTSGLGLADFLRKLGSMATGPQVAMAMLLLLMVGIGLWSAPRLTSREHGSGTAVLQPDPDGEAGPSAGALTPAEPLRLEVDPRTDRIIDAEELAAIEERRRAEPRGVEARREMEELDDPSASDALAERRQRAPTQAHEGRTEEAQRAATADEAQAEQATEALAALEADLAPGEGVGSVAGDGVAAGEAPEASSASSAAVASVERRSATRAPVTSAPTRADAPVAPSAQPYGYRVEPTAPPPTEAPTQPPQASAGRAAEGVPPPSVDTGAALAAGLHQQGREAGSSGRYAQCVSTYQQLLERHPTYAQTGRALIELAECQRRLGQITVAERTLQRAQRYPAVRPDADRRLSTLRAERAAMDREMEMDRPAAAPSSAD